ncbi:centrosomal protein of 83 kDa isoform X1 [Stigmatopora nigra]
MSTKKAPQDDTHILHSCAMTSIRQSFPAARSLGSSPGAETELQKMFMDERSKCELHRANYETLKAEHNGLRDEFIQIQEEVRHLQAELERLQLQLVERSREILDKNREIEELRMQVVTPQRLELLRVQVQQDMEGPVRERFSKLEEEAEKYRSDFNALRYSYTVLNAQFEHQKEEHARVVEEQKLRYQTEIAQLDKDKENLVAQYQNVDVHHDKKQMEILLKEKTHLTLRLKALQAEVMELQAQKDHSGQQAEILQHVHNRQIAESQTSLKSMEAERQSLRMRLERMEGELKLSNEQNSQLMGQLHKAEKQVNSLNCLIESLKHSHKMEVASIKLECTRCKGELERERDDLKGQMEGLQTELDSLKNMVERHKDILVEKDREAARKVQAAHDEGISKSALLHEEKLELEYRLAMLEQQIGLQDAKEQAQRDEWEERLRLVQREDVLRKTQQSLKTTLKQQSAQLEELERQTSEISLLQQNNQELRAELSASSQARAELMGANQRLQAEVGDMREKLREARVQAERSQHEAERRTEESQIEWLEEKHKFEERNAKMEEKYSQLKDKMKKVSVAQKKRRNQTEYKEKKLQHKIQLLKAQMEELKLEAAAANKRPLHSEENAQLRRRMRELQRRHNEFRRLMLGDQANYKFAPTLTSTANFHISNAGSTVPEEEEHKEIILIRERMDELEKDQQRQLEELEGCG